MSNTQDKTIIDFLKDLGSLKPSEFWTLLSVIATIVFGIFMAGYKIGGWEMKREIDSCNLALERRTHLLVEAEDQLGMDLQTRIKAELRNNGE